MEDRQKLLRALIGEGATQVDLALGLLWLYKIKQEFDERTSEELIQDLFDGGFSKPNKTRFRKQLRQNKKTVKGSRVDSFKINPRFFSELDSRFAPLLSYEKTSSSSSVIPQEFIEGTGIYIQRMVGQINGCYDRGFYDASSVMLRRLLESLIIESYIREKRVSKIKDGPVFKTLDKLINIITTDPGFTLSRSVPKDMQFIKDIGDTAAHNRTYITPKEDIGDNMQKIRRLISEMLHISGLKK